MISSVRARLTLWYVGGLAVVLLVFAALVYLLHARSLAQSLDDDLRQVQEVAASSLAQGAEEGRSLEEAASNTVRQLDPTPQTVAIYGANGRLLAQDGGDEAALARPQFDRLPPRGEMLLYTEDAPHGGEGPRRVCGRRLDLTPGGRQYVIVNTHPLAPLAAEMASLRRLIAYAIPTALALAGLGGWFLARRSLAPAVAMSEQARRISVEDLSRRLVVANPEDELGHLARNFNELLERLAGAIEQQRSFMADASHELRTPLAATVAAVDVTLSREHRTEQEYRDGLAVIGKQSRRLTRVVEDLFLLARADAAEYPVRHNPLYLDEVLNEAVQVAGILGGQRGVRVRTEVSGDAPAVGDEDLLRQMIVNLLDNGVKYTEPGGEVVASLERERDGYSVVVTDTGRGIPADDRGHVFERFYRADRGRSRTEASVGSGAGLGLSIARWIAEAHGGSLELVRTGEAGTTFRARLSARGDSGASSTP